MASRSKRIFTITLNNWDKHNKDRKKGYRKALIPHDFFDDQKVTILTPTAKLLFIYVILQCDRQSGSGVSLSERQLRSVIGPGELMSTSLNRLQELQLLTYVMHGDAYKENRSKEKEVKEEKRIPVGSDGPPPAPIELVPDEPPKPKPNTEANRKVWDAYRQEYQKRYKVEPVRNAKTNSAVASFVKRIGEQEAAEVVRFFVWHNDAYYLKSTHSIGLALKDAESLRTQWLKGRAITMLDVRNFERQDGYAEQMRKIEAGEI